MWAEWTATARAGLAQVGEALNEYGPPIAMPASWSVPPVEPPPPPPPVPHSAWLLEGWARHRTLVAYTLGGAVAVGVGMALYRPRPIPAHGEIKDGRRTQAVIVLGGDTTLGRALCLALAAKQLIVLASVADDRGKKALEADVPASSKGYVKPLMLAADDGGAAFVHAVHAALCLRYPMASAGDPYARPGEYVEVIGAVNALSFAPDADAPRGQRTAAQRDDALKTHVVTPLSTLHRLVALLTALPSHGPRHAPPALVVSLVSLADAHVAEPRHGVAPLIVQSVRTGIATLRRESELQYHEQCTRSWTWRGTAVDAKQRAVRWTTVEVDAPSSACFQQRHRAASRDLVRPGRAPPPAPLHHAALDKVAALLMARAYPVWPVYSIARTSKWAQWWGYARTALAACIPPPFMDILIAIHLRFHRRLGSESLDKHRDATTDALLYIS